MAEDGNPNNYVFVFTDESYVHNTHSLSNSYHAVGSDCRINKSSSKGRRLIILHAITPDGPLCERDSNGIPVDDLTWKGDTPHPLEENMRTPDDPLTCETLWLATSNKGDYHANMDSDNFMRWATNRLLPTFKKLHPGKKMVLICDNAPYHHKREIGSMDTKTKKQLIEMMTNDAVDYVELPLNDDRKEYMDEVGAPLIRDEGAANIASGEEGEDENTGAVQNIANEAMRIRFLATEQQQTACNTRPRVGTVDEIKQSYILWLKRHKPQRLECKFEALLKENGFEVLWTPPYCPDLQPIELFWAAGKNHVGLLFEGKRTMKETVRQLREGCYGSFEAIQEDGEKRKKTAVNCNKLFMTSIKKANEIFIPMCQGSLRGEIGNLWIDPDYKVPTVDIPIDTLLLEYTTDTIADDENEE
jgi:transposase